MPKRRKQAQVNKSIKGLYSQRLHCPQCGVGVDASQLSVYSNCIHPFSKSNGCQLIKKSFEDLFCEKMFTGPTMFSLIQPPQKVFLPQRDIPLISGSYYVRKVIIFKCPQCKYQRNIFTSDGINYFGGYFGESIIPFGKIVKG